MSKYFTFFKFGAQMPIVYRGPVVVWLLNNFLSAAVFAALWLSAETGGGSIGSYSRSGLISYYIFALALQWIVGLFPFYSTVRNIKDGSIVLGALIKPFSYFKGKLAEEIGWHAVAAFFGLATTLVLVVLFRDFLVVNNSPVSLFLTVTAVGLAALTNFGLSLCLGMTAFWFTEVYALDGLFWAGRTILGGQGIPVSFIPGFYFSLVQILPFRYLFSFPLEIFFNQLSPGGILFGFIAQILWIVIFVMLYRWLWNHGRRAYAAFGQ